MMRGPIPPGGQLRHSTPAVNSAATQVLLVRAPGDNAEVSGASDPASSSRHAGGPNFRPNPSKGTTMCAHIPIFVSQDRVAPN